MIHSVILTVKIEHTNIVYDMELPTNIPGSRLCEKLLAALKNLENETFNSVEEIRIRLDQYGKLLGDDETLQGESVWDGSVVTVVRKGRCVGSNGVRI